MNGKLLVEGLSALGLPCDGPEAERLGRYVDAIEAWNPAYGLVGASGDELIIKHILDSLAPLPILDRLIAASTEPAAAAVSEGGGSPGPAAAAGPTVVDLGTGAGLPGIPLAIVRPSWSITLLDRMTRRIRFLEAMRGELALDNVEIVEEQVERARGSYDLVTFRAWKPFERKLFKRVFALCSPSGAVAAYKGRADRAREELAELAGMYGSAEMEPVIVPFLPDERCVVSLRPIRRA